MNGRSPERPRTVDTNQAKNEALQAIKQLPNNLISIYANARTLMSRKLITQDHYKKLTEKSRGWPKDQLVRKYYLATESLFFPEKATEEKDIQRQKKLSGRFGARLEGYEKEWAEYQEYLSKLKPDEGDTKYSLNDLRDLRVKLREIMRYGDSPRTADPELAQRARDLHNEVNKRTVNVLEYGIKEVGKRVKRGVLSLENGYDALAGARESLTEQDALHSFELSSLAEKLENEKEKYGRKIGGIFMATIDEKSE